MTWIAAIGESDCEDLGSGLLAQPVNAITSLAFSALGVGIVAWAARADGLERTIRLGFGWLLVATGVGSFLFHGPQWAGSRFVHDITFLAAVAFLATFNVVVTTRRAPRTGWIVFAVATAIAALVLVVAPDATNVLTGLVVTGLVASDIILHRVGSHDGRWYATAIVLLALALIANVAGRTGSPVCDAGSVLQAHGAWHVLAGGFLTAYFVSTAPARAGAGA